MTSLEQPFSPARPLFYGRRKGKKLHGGRQVALDVILPQVRISLPCEEHINPGSLFSHPVQAIHFEIGFGDGAHLIAQALRAPDIGFIGCEPFMNGVAGLCLSIQTHQIKNIRIWPDDARLLMAALTSHTVDCCYILNSDPWPKKRHHKRRFIQTETLNEIHRLLKKDGLLRLSSDHPGLTVWHLEKVFFHKGYAWTAKTAADWRLQPADMIETRYQIKNMAKHPMTFLNFKAV